MVIFNRFTPTNVDFHELKFIKKILQRYLKGIFITRESGSLLYSWQIDSHFQLDLISQFIAALSMFGEEKIGHIRRILIEGLNIEIAVVSKHGLIITTVFKADMVKDHLNLEGERILDRFVEQFSAPLAENRSNQSIYQQFDAEFWNFIYQYLHRIGIIEKTGNHLQYTEQEEAKIAQSSIK